MSKHSLKPGTPGDSEENSPHDDVGDGREIPRENPWENPVENAGITPESPIAGTPEEKIAALEAELADREHKLADAEAKIADLNDQFLRKSADFENFRKRMNREKQELTEFANISLILDLLPVIDDFERAIKFAENSHDFASLYEGIIMIEKQLSGLLENKWGLKRFISEGEPFDPNRHEALQMEKAAGIAEAVVKEEFVKGYSLKEKVIRYAKVKVLMPEDEAGSASAGQPG